MSPYRALSAAVQVLALVAGCRGAPPEDRAMTPPSPRRPIESVLADHTPELMALPGVVGTYQGAGTDGAPFIGVMVARRSRALERKIPRTLEGYPVRIEVTGTIRPMEGDR